MSIRTKTDWQKIKEHYLKGETSLKDLAELYKVNYNTLKTHLQTEKWAKLKREKEIALNKELIQKAEQKDRHAITIMKKQERTLANLAKSKVKLWIKTCKNAYELRTLLDSFEKIQKILYKSYGIEQQQPLVNLDMRNNSNMIEKQEHIQQPDQIAKVLEILVEAGAFKTVEQKTEAEIIQMRAEEKDEKRKQWRKIVGGKEEIEVYSTEMQGTESGLPYWIESQLEEQGFL